MNRLEIVGIKQIEIADNLVGGAVILAVTAHNTDIEIHLTLEALVGLEAILAAGTAQQAKRHIIQ